VPALAPSTTTPSSDAKTNSLSDGLTRTATETLAALSMGSLGFLVDDQTPNRYVASENVFGFLSSGLFDTAIQRSKTSGLVSDCMHVVAL
jgi:hypothetical protein